MESSDTFLKQKIEFMQSELEQYKKKEQDHNRLNESLMLILGKNEENLLSTHTINEYKKTIEQQRKEIQDLKLRHKDELLSLEKELNTLKLENKELEFKLKQQRLTLDAEKLDIMNKMIKLEADKLSAEKELKTKQSELIQLQSLQQYQIENKLSDVHRKIEMMNEEHLNEIKKVRQEADKSVVEIKVIYEQEIESLKEQAVGSQGKIRELLKEIEDLKEKKSSSGLKDQVFALEEELEQYRMLVRHSVRQEREEFRSINSDIFVSKDSSGNSVRKKDEDQVFLSSGKAHAQNHKFVAEIERLRNLNENICKEKEDGERRMKNEIKYLIGKLLKAKSKISAKGELTGNMRRESMMNTLRSSGFNQTNLPFKKPSRLSKDL